MANPRSTDTKIPRVTRRATAAPVDTYVQQPVTNVASQLAEALGEFNPSLKKYSQEFLARDNAEKLQAGIAEAQKMAIEGKKAGALTRSGDLAMQDNAWFKAGLEEEEGRLTAGKWRSDFISSEEFKAIKDSTNIEDFDAAAAKFNAQFLKANPSGSDFHQRGFGTLQSNYQAAARYEFAVGIEGKLGARSDAALFGRVVQIVMDDRAARLAGKQIDPEVTIAAINKAQEARIASGRHERFVRKTVIDAMEDIARNMEDPKEALKMLSMWDQIDGTLDGQKAGIGRSQYGLEKLNQLKRDLTGDVFRKETRDREEAERNEKNLIEKAQGEFFAELANNSMSTGQSILMKPEYESVRPKLNDLFARSVQTNDSRIHRSNEYLVRQTLDKIFSPAEGEPPVTTEYIGNLQNVSPGDKVMLNNQLENAKRAKGNGAWERLFKDDAINEERKAIADYFTDPITKTVKTEWKNKSRGAITAFNARVLKELENGNYDAVGGGERLVWLRKLAAELGIADPTIMNKIKLQGVEQYQLDPNQPNLGRVPDGSEKAGTLAPQKPGEKGAQAPTAPATPNPFTGMKSMVAQWVLDAALDPQSPEHHEAVEAVKRQIKRTQQPVTEENLDLFIDAQLEVLSASKGTQQ